ncbi:MAG: ABC transporter permease, partial [Campylobacterota bacterium]|nr:ABC transporter permease [Campylobacterota bacterium]
MITIFFAMVKKEFLLVLRDKHALAALFIMPAIFILIMSVALRDQFGVDAIKFSLHVEDLDKSRVSKELIEKLHKDENFAFVKEDAAFKIVIPRGYYKPFRFSKKEHKSLEIVVMGNSKSDLLEIFKSKLMKNVIELKLQYIKKRLSRVSNEASDELDSLKITPNELFNISYNKSEKVPNSTQQSVPTWIVFGLFFVIIPISTIFINEKKQNTLSRLYSMNVSIFSLSLAKVVPYLLINHIQVWVMLGVGMFIVPIFNTPALQISGSILALELVSISLSVAAIGLAMLIASSATSSEQATT